MEMIPCLQGNIEKPYYLGTREVLELAGEALSLGGDPDELHLVCHKDHKRRVRGLARNLGLRINEIFSNVDSYDATEPQLWCRYRFLFILVELSKLLLHWVKREI